MSAKLTISTRANHNLNAIADIFAEVFEHYPENQSNKLKFTAGKAPEMGMGVRPITHIDLLLENHSKEALEEIEPLLNVMAAILNKHVDEGVDVQLTLSDGTVKSIWTSDIT